MKHLLLFFIIALIIVCFLLIMITLVRDPHNTMIVYLFSWKYRILRRIRSEYLWGLRRTPPNDYQYFHQGAINLIEKEHVSHYDEAKDIICMLEAPQFIHYYFVDMGSFSGEVFHRMYTDFRTGVYCTRDYDLRTAMKKILPLEISTNEGAFNGFMKFVDAGWFDHEGMFVLSDKRDHQYIGRAIYWICKRNGIPAPEKVFAPFWNVEASKIKDWKRINKKETITESIDQKVFSILN